MRFSWDPNKDATTLERRGFDFRFAIGIFDGPLFEKIDSRRAYGEQRVIATGLANGDLITVVYTDRTDAGETVRRIISARGASRHERKAYSQATAHPAAGRRDGRPGIPPEPVR